VGRRCGAAPAQLPLLEEWLEPVNPKPPRPEELLLALLLELVPDLLPATAAAVPTAAPVEAECHQDERPEEP